MSKNIGAQPPTLDCRDCRDCIIGARQEDSGLLVLMTGTYLEDVPPRVDLDSLEILTALGACVRARRWAGRRV